MEKLIDHYEVDLLEITNSILKCDMFTSINRLVDIIEDGIEEKTVISISAFYYCLLSAKETFVFSYHEEKHDSLKDIYHIPTEHLLSLLQDSRLKHYMHSIIKGIEAYCEEDYPSSIDYFVEAQTLDLPYSVPDYYLSVLYLLDQDEEESFKHFKRLSRRTQESAFSENDPFKPTFPKVDRAIFVKLMNKESLRNTITTEVKGVKETVLQEGQQRAQEHRVVKQKLDEIEKLLLSFFENVQSEFKKIHTEFAEKLSNVSNPSGQEELIDLVSTKMMDVLDQKLASQPMFHNRRNQVEEELKESYFKTVWGRLTESAKTFVITSELIFQNIRYLEDIDFSPAVLPIAKALELTLKVRIGNKLKNYASGYARRNGNLPSFMFDKDGKEIKFTLGNYPHLLGNPDVITILKQENLIEHVNLFDESQASRDEFISNLEQIAKLRNEVAHTQKIVLSRVIDCRKIMLLEYGLLIKVLNKFK